MTAENTENSTQISPDARLDELFAELQANDEGWRLAESEILRIWSLSGSPSMDLLLQRGMAALDQGDLDAAIGHLTALTDHAPDFAEGWSLRGQALMLAGQTGPALADLGRALQIEPRQFTALTSICVLFEDAGDDARARSACEESLAIHPHQQEAIDALARIARRMEGTLL